ncbi:MAG: restriction endonuclease subunit S, partial [Peptostreptococcaceae bacterium]|nr:restriction endonuclease subunit S [Peptostreptococcaceae bacterium]
QARMRQYQHYRDMLLSEEYLNKISEKCMEKTFIEWRKLGELFEFKNGLNKGKEFFGRGTPIINYTDVYKKNRLYLSDVLGTVETTEDEQKRYSVKRGDVFFTRTSETQEEIGKTSVLLEDVEQGVFSGFVLRARPITELLLPEYCAYCFETYEFRKNVIRYSTYTTRALTNGTILSNLEIPVPSVGLQKKVVEILDKFQSLLEDTKGLLPKEIEQRKKQYEYYREKLLTFESEYDRPTDRP